MKKNKARRIVLTGGHAATTAISVAEEMKKDKKVLWDIYWIGSRRAIEGSRIPTLESKAFPALGIKSFNIISGRIQRSFSFWTIPAIFKIPLGFIQAFQILSQINPEVILSFGGHAAFPVVIGAFIKGIPIIIHEQTSSIGRVNKYSSFFAKKIAIAREKSMPFFPKEKTTVVGNPVMSSILGVGLKKVKSARLSVFVTCGSRGSQAINKVLASSLPEILKEFYLIHQTGALDYSEFLKIKNNLPREIKERYQVYSNIDPLKIHAFFDNADIIIARAGANTVSEILAVKRPAILIPLPLSYKNEQLENAMHAKSIGLARVINQDKLTPETLLKTIVEVKNNLGKISDKIKDYNSPDREASKKLVELIKKEIL